MRTLSFPSLLISSLIIISTFYSCSKIALSIDEKYEQDERFFLRNIEIKNRNRLNSSSNYLDSNYSDIIDKVIVQLKESDLKSKFSNVVIKNYGYPDWESSVVFNNSNGFKTVIAPVVSKNGNVKIAIVCYQIDDKRTKFKIINRNANIKHLPKYGNRNGTIFSQESYKGLFEGFEKRIKEISSFQNGSVRSNSTYSIEANQTYVYTYSYCWTYSILGSDGSVLVNNWHCSYHIVIQPSFINYIPGDWEIPQPGDSGGGGGSETTNQKIIDSLAGYPCAQAVLAKVPDINEFTKQVIQDIFGINDDINMTFSVGTPNDFDDQTDDGNARCNGGQTIFDCVIKLNPLMLSSATEDYIFITMVHEAIHGYIQYKRHTLDPTTFAALFPLYFPRNYDSHHRVMAGNQANNFVSKMAAALMAFNPYITSQTATALAWGGLGETDQWKQLGSDTSAIIGINIEGKYPSASGNPYGFKICP